MPNHQRGEVWLADLGIAAKVRPGAGCDAMMYMSSIWKRDKT